MGRNPLVTRFLHGALRPPVQSHVPPWDPAVVLEALCRPPFVPIEEISDHHLTLKTTCLLMISSLNRVGDLQALSVTSFNSKCGGLQGLPRRCPNTGHLQRCRLVHAPDLRRVLWPRYAGHSRLFRSLALVVLLRDTHRAGTWKSGSMGISFPKASYRTQLEFLKRNASGYVCNAASQCHTYCIPASVLLHSLKLMPAASHVLLYQLVITSPRP